MMKLFIRCILIALVSSVATAEQKFYLVEEHSDETVGPIILTNDAPIELRDTTYRVKLSRDKATQTEAFLHKVIIPSIEFREASVPDVISFLVSASRGGIDEPRLNMVPMNMPPPQSEEDVPTITLQLSRVSLYDAITIVCDKADLSFRIDEQGIVRIEPKHTEKHSGQQWPAAGRETSSRP